jgi:U32 family peptidase
MIEIKSKNIEIMSPVGSYEALTAAIQAGAGSVYFGIGKLNMRSRSSVNFSHDDLAKITDICDHHNVKSYLTVNTVVFNNEINELTELLDYAKECKVSAIIASDFAVLEYAKKIGLEIHISTQCNITNIEAVRFFSRYADVMVLAREVQLSQVAEITKKIEEDQICGPSGNLVQIEIFIHGALCMAVSGKCYLSLDNFNYSANRGACLQPCRRGYKVQDLDQEVELAIENQYIMSPKDLCTITFLDKIIHAGVSVLKIEGRGRSPEYVKMVTQCYQEALQSIEENTYSREKIQKWSERLKSVYNRDFWDGYYLGRKLGEWTERYGSQATRVKLYVGKITNYFSKLNVAEVLIETNQLDINDEFLIIGPTTGVYENTLQEIRVDLKVVQKAEKGNLCSIPVDDTVRKNDKVYKWITQIDEF